MLTKKKECAGFNGVPHEAYIYKNIGGEKYCKSCAFKLQPPKQIRKVSEKQVFKMSIKKELLEKDKAFYTEVWIKRFFKDSLSVPGTYIKVKVICCENPECKKRLPDEPNLMFFHHVLEKRNFPEYRHEEQNIAILCAECHNAYETFPDSVPYLKDLRIKLLTLLYKK